jgi:sulfur-carrier protein adenylyltransferase/sulfurtransferase
MGEGFEEVYNLKGGIRAWEGHEAAGPPEMGLEYLDGIETPGEVILFAYGMEESLGGFYKEAAGRTANPDAEQLLTKLAGVEEKHKNQLFRLYKDVVGKEEDRSTFESHVVSGVLEGGLSAEKYMGKIMGVESPLDNVFSVAMMFEAQAMDLYMRYSEAVEQEQGKTLFHDLAEQEKAHLKLLGIIKDKEMV